MHEVLHGIAKTSMDHVKDAQMQYDYAVEAAEHGNHDIASLHLAEAKMHLDSARAWYDRGMKMLEQSGNGKMEPLTEALIEREKDHYHEVLNRAANFKPGA